MTARRVLTAALLLFVAAGIATAVVKEYRDKHPNAGAPVGIGKGPRAEGRQIIAYYFLGKVRCSSCRKIEEVSRKTIEGAFPRELSDGRLRFVTANVDQPENRHFIEDFRLESSSLVLVEMREGRPVAWKNLPDVWTLVEDETRLATYVRDEVAAKLRGI